MKMKAQYGRELEVREYLDKLKARALSSEEPDTLEYRVAEYDGTFALWETYKSSAALKWCVPCSVLRKHSSDQCSSLLL